MEKITVTVTEKTEREIEFTLPIFRRNPQTGSVMFVDKEKHMFEAIRYTHTRDFQFVKSMFCNTASDNEKAGKWDEISKEEFIESFTNMIGEFKNEVLKHLLPEGDVVPHINDSVPYCTPAIK